MKTAQFKFLTGLCPDLLPGSRRQVERADDVERLRGGRSAAAQNENLVAVKGEFVAVPVIRPIINKY